MRSVAANVNLTSAPPGSSAWWRARYQKQTRARGRPPELSLAKIVEAALSILDEEGLSELTMRRLATELGTASGSLYRHVASRKELLVAVGDKVLGELREPGRELPWRQAVEELARDLRGVLLAHRGVVLVITSAPLLGPNAIRLRELFWGAMDRDGCAPEFAVQVYFTVMHFVVSSALFSAGSSRKPGTAWSGQTPSGLRDLIDVLPATEYPTVIRFSAFGDRPDPNHDFEFGLRALLDGLASYARQAT
jgi:TetR/AcrR family transcriptional regulator, tetracycline repressor protein